MPRSILFVHPSADLYGSDRVLLDLITGLDREQYQPRVALPRWGPLADRLRALEVETHVLPVGKIERGQLNALGPLRIGRGVLSSVRALDHAFAPSSIDLVHTNTLAAWGGAAWARRHRIPHVWHLHEIVERPAWAGRALAALSAFGADRVLCNSEATRRWLLERAPSARGKATVLPVTRERPPREAVAARSLRAGLGLSDEHLLVALVGRISPRKGQEVLIGAAERVRASNLAYALVGDPPPGQGAWGERLARRLAAAPQGRAFHVLGYRDDVWAVWDACDVAVVPSLRPESFGLVALEAMLAGKPVVASRIGALPDLVIHERTGLLVPPNDPGALAEALDRLARDPELRARLGAAGRAAASAGEGRGAAARRLEALYAGLIDGAPRHPVARAIRRRQ